MEIQALADQLGTYHTDVKNIAVSVSDLERQVEKIDAVLKRPGFGGGDIEGRGSRTNELKALGTFVRTGDDSALKAMSVGSDPDGGYFVTPAISSGMTKKLFDATTMRQLARVETITTGSEWREPLDLGEPGAIWVGEKTARPVTDTPQVGMFSVPIHEIYSNVPVTQNLLDDTGFDLGAWVEGKVTDKFARSEGASFIIGNGISKPRGIMTYDVDATADATRPWGKLQYIPSGSASGISADALRDLTWALRAPYRTGATFLMNSSTASFVDKLKDGNGNYLWRDSMTAGAPPSLLGYPVVTDESMPDVAGDAFPIAFGNFRLGYVIVDKLGVRFLRDPFSDKPNVLFYAYKRVGGAVAHFEAIKLLKVATS